jgi:predicted metal-dependent peptidase
VQEAVESDGIEEWLRRGRAKGGGGTNHVPVFEYIARSGRKPDLFIGLTDLESQFPARPPTYPVVWVTPERHGKAPFGAVVEVR